MYDKNKDKLVKLFELDKGKGKLKILFKIMSYNNNKPKLRISSMYEKLDGSVGYGIVSGLGKEELEFLSSILSEVQDIINNYGDDV